MKRMVSVLIHVIRSKLGGETALPCEILTWLKFTCIVSIRLNYLHYLAIAQELIELCYTGQNCTSYQSNTWSVTSVIVALS